MVRRSDKTALKVSVLVPVYNVEKYLRECLDSLINQSLREIEIVCINDGSKDDSLDIIKEYAATDDRIKIVNKKNTGYGDSMNRGLMEASGEYVGIVEPDDFVELDTFEKMYNVAKENEVDVVKANFYEYSTEKKEDTYKSDLFLDDEIEKVINIRSNRHIFFQQPSVWSAIYSRDLLLKNGIKFLPSEGASYQDAGFTFKVWAVAKRVFFMDNAFLHYRKDNPNSSVKSDGKVFAVKDEYDEVERFLKERDLMDEFGQTLAIVRMGGYIWNMRRLSKPAALEFARVLKEDYSKYKKAGFLNNEGLEKDAEFIVNNPIIRNPERYVRTRYLYELNDKMRTKLYRAYKSLNNRSKKGGNRNAGK